VALLGSLLVMSALERRRATLEARRAAGSKVRRGGGARPPSAGPQPAVSGDAVELPAPAAPESPPAAAVGEHSAPQRTRTAKPSTGRRWGRTSERSASARVTDDAEAAGGPTTRSAGERATTVGPSTDVDEMHWSPSGTDPDRVDVDEPAAGGNGDGRGRPGGAPGR